MSLNRNVWRVSVIGALVLGAAPAAAGKVFRNYYGMQWTWEPLPLSAAPVAKDGVAFKARLVPETLFVVDGDVRSGSQLLIAKGTQLTQMHSRKGVRCTVGPGAAGTLSAARRVCVVDQDGDGQYEGYFDVGLGFQIGQIQFSGCLPLAATAAQVPAMHAIDASTADWPMLATFKVTRFKAIAGVLHYQMRVTIKREDKPAVDFSLCSADQRCWIPTGQQMETQGKMVFRARQSGAESLAFDVIEPMHGGYYDMKPGGRPPAWHCPGTLFVKTDEMDVW